MLGGYMRAPHGAWIAGCFSARHPCTPARFVNSLMLRTFFRSSNESRRNGLRAAQAIESAVERRWSMPARQTEAFTGGICSAVRTRVDRGGDRDVDFTELAHLYRDTDLHTPTEHLPLDAADRVQLRNRVEDYHDLRDHPLNPFREKNTTMELAFQAAGHAKVRPTAYRDFGPGDILQSLQRTESRLRFLAGKHYALRRVRELCRLARGKWEAAGALAPIDATGLVRILDSLCQRHLVLREADHGFSVHPAVRDHFHGLATGQGNGRWHDLIRSNWSLTRQPGKGCRSSNSEPG